ncbi:hypothetical protein JG688_00009961 [Phytophthora aleatoria]|uniref:Uncharacterized protein n=1 Tax=Phytophthora aleatoria TaxID=2496075 RepID=A0A8J5MFU1_9STRA|nr:hypothetical protein JG688_00009961 [Phytophthora aleatoria]
MAAFDTSRYLGLVNAGRLPESWMKVMQIRLRRQPLVTNAKVPPKILSSLPCVAPLQTMLLEAGFEFLNVVPIWSEVSEVAGVPVELIYRGVEKIQHRIFGECVEWNKLVRGVNYHIRQPLDLLPEPIIVTDSNAQKTDADGDI